MTEQFLFLLFFCGHNFAEELNVNWSPDNPFLHLLNKPPTSAAAAEPRPDTDSFFPTRRQSEEYGMKNHENTGLTGARVSTDRPAGTFLFREPSQRLSAGRQTYKHTHLRPTHLPALMWQRWNGPFLFSHSPSTPLLPLKITLRSTHQNRCHADKSSPIADIQKEILQITSHF